MPISAFSLLKWNSADNAGYEQYLCIQRFGMYLGSLDPSHVPAGNRLPHEIAHGSLRLTLSDENTFEEMDYTVEKIKETVDKLRKMSASTKILLVQIRIGTILSDNGGIIMYTKKVMDHLNPRNMGEIENPSCVGTVGNAKCGYNENVYGY